MTKEKRHIGLFGVTGVLVAALIIAGFILAGNIFRAKGVLTVEVIDAPVELKNLNITIDWIRIQGTEGWVNLTLKTEPFYFDLLKLQNISETLSVTEIPSGNFSMIEMHVLTANATYLNDTTASLTVPSDVIKVLLNPHMELEAGGQVTVIIDLQPEDLTTIAISQSLNLRPVVRSIID